MDIIEYELKQTKLNLCVIDIINEDETLTSTAPVVMFRCRHDTPTTTTLGVCEL